MSVVVSPAIKARLHCDAPVYNSFTGHARCRKCSRCLKRRQWEWYWRAMVESWRFDRSIFLTVTFRKATNDVEGYKEVQKFIKRVRKEHAGSSLKYLCSSELGERGGRQHFHLLVHCSDRVSVHSLRSQWSHGITHGRIATGSIARYVAKYSAKAGGRVRASASYGSVDPSVASRLLGGFARWFPVRFTFYRGARIGGLRLNGKTIPRSMVKVVHSHLLDYFRQEEEKQAKLSTSKLNLAIGEGAAVAMAAVPASNMGRLANGRN